ncbi:MAG: glutamine--fructose-6-phosphate transaminase (isomerizing) [Bdellovibrionales bacterium]|nr:glutamine--fructose-6-phosphate transaminase (isomerizing) [Bdellovibrionales bacterium]
MCGILGYVGPQNVSEVLIEGLRKLEYRGYDSTGIAVFSKGDFQLYRSKGKIAALVEKIGSEKPQGHSGIGHTRWATHGKPSDENAHPHRSENLVLVHNGIIENHVEIRQELESRGVCFSSETDTEVIPHLMEHCVKEGMSIEDALYSCIAKLKGAFAIAVFSKQQPEKIYAAKNASPIILGIGQGENFISSDIPAILDHTRKVVVLEDGEVAMIDREKYWITDFDRNPIERDPKEITWSRIAAEKEGYKHFMLKEIYEQPRALADCLRGRVDEKQYLPALPEVSLPKLESMHRVILIACGTSWHAALVAKYWMESFIKIPVEVEVSSEFRYRDPVLDSNTLVILISQSGETADTLAAMTKAKPSGARMISICNVIDSSIARKSDDVMYTHAGPEIGVASTKAFTTQLTALALLTLAIAYQRKSISNAEVRDMTQQLLHLPSLIEECLDMNPHVEKLAKELIDVRDVLYIGRGSSYAIALEGALKLKEISYIHAEGYMGGELKHGPIALIDKDLPVVALVSGGPTYEKMLSNIEEVKARGAFVIGVCEQGDQKVQKQSRGILEVPQTSDFLRPIVESIPLQLLSYHVAEQRGCDVDQPRNLAKSVTVE